VEQQKVMYQYHFLAKLVANPVWYTGINVQAMDH
jgi:hypothetical protein